MQDHIDQDTRSNMVDLPTGRFHYLSWGTEDSERPCALLLQGVTSSALSWIRVGPTLADRYRVYALDLRGHGDSIKSPAGSYSLRHIADDVTAFIEALDLQQPLLIGHSWGGATAIVLASGAESEKPAPRFSKVILEDPACDFRSANLEELAANYTKDIGRPTEELRSELLANNPGWTEADIEGKLDAMQKVSREAVKNIFIESATMGNIIHLLANIATPTLLIRADPSLNSTVNAKNWEKARDYLSAPNRAVQIDGAPHNIHRSNFDDFMQVVNDFLRQ